MRLPMFSRWCSRALPLLLCAAAGLVQGCAFNTRAVPGKMLDLNRRAIEEYEAGQYDHAKAALLEALALGKRANLTKHEAVVRTHMNLGIVYAGGFKDRTRGVHHLAVAIKAQPGLKLTPSLATPTVKRAFASARVLARRKGGIPALKDEEPKPTTGMKVGEPVMVAPTVDSKASEPKTPEPKIAEPAKPKVVDAPKPPPEPKKVAAPEPVAVARAKEPQKAPAKPAPAEEPDVPATIPEALFCPTADEAPPGVDIPLRCVARPGQRPAHVVLYYRSAGSETFTTVPMVRSGKGWYSGVVPGSAVSGKALQYYFEGQTGAAKAFSTNGQADSPNLMILRAGAPPAGQGALAALRVEKDDEAGPDEPEKEDNPLDQVERERAESLLHRREPGHLWLGAGAGSGYGWHPARDFEFHTGLRSNAGFASGGLAHVTLEVGYQIDEELAVAIQVRHQFIPESGSGDAQPGSPPHGADAIFLRAFQLHGEGNTQLFWSGTLGGGSGFRLVVPPKAGLARNDTIRGGPVVLGPGAGLLHHFSPRVAFVAELRGLMGLPDFALVADFTIGMQLSF